MHEFCSQFSIEIANGSLSAEEANIWTFESSIYGLHCIVYSQIFRSHDVSTNDELDLGSDPSKRIDLIGNYSRTMIMEKTSQLIQRMEIQIE